jgi:hypothetical protein
MARYRVAFATTLALLSAVCVGSADALSLAPETVTLVSDPPSDVSATVQLSAVSGLPAGGSVSPTQPAAGAGVVNPDDFTVVLQFTAFGPELYPQIFVRLTESDGTIVPWTGGGCFPDEPPPSCGFTLQGVGTGSDDAAILFAVEPVVGDSFFLSTPTVSLGTVLTVYSPGQPSPQGLVFLSGSATVVPEPGTILLLGSGVVGLVMIGRAKRD